MQDRNFAVLLKEKLKIFSLIELFPDIRKNPEIPLRDIILSLFLMPFFGLTSLLSLDREARKKQFKKLFGSKRKMVVSDSTLKRVLSWLSRKTAIFFLLEFLKVFEKVFPERSLHKRARTGASVLSTDLLWALIIW